MIGRSALQIGAAINKRETERKKAKKMQASTPTPTPTPTAPIPTVGEADRIAWALALTSTRTLAPATDKLCLAVEGALIRLARLGNSGAWVRSSDGTVIVRGTLPGAPEGFGRWEVRLSATPHRIDPYAPPETLAELLKASADK